MNYSHTHQNLCKTLYFEWIYLFKNVMIVEGLLQLINRDLPASLMVEPLSIIFYTSAHTTEINLSVN